MKPQIFPPGWNEDRVRDVLNHYENQTEDEAVAEDEAMFGSSESTFVEIPNEILPQVKGLLAEYAGRR